MPRTIVYPHRYETMEVSQVVSMRARPHGGDTYDDDLALPSPEEDGMGAPAGYVKGRRYDEDEPETTVRTVTAVNPGDGYAERLVKYIPGEVLAAYVPLTALAGGRGGLVVLAFVVGLAGTPLYLWRDSWGKVPAERPLRHFYVLASVSFVVWAFFMLLVAFLLPGLDAAITRVLRRDPQSIAPEEHRRAYSAARSHDRRRA